MLICHLVLNEMGLNGSSEEVNAMNVELYDPGVAIDNQELSVLKRTFDPFAYSVDECEDLYIAVRQFINECI